VVNVVESCCHEVADGVQVEEPPVTPMYTYAPST
jgi:hypothetical protein